MKVQNLQASLEATIRKLESRVASLLRDRERKAEELRGLCRIIANQGKALDEAGRHLPERPWESVVPVPDYRLYAKYAGKLPAAAPRTPLAPFAVTEPWLSGMEIVWGVEPVCLHCRQGFLRGEMVSWLVVSPISGAEIAHTGCTR